MRDAVRTLVVDDEPGIRFFIRETLARSGHDVITAGDGTEALSLLREHEFDLVIIDLRLGGHVDGLRVLEALRWRWPSAVAIILTAHGSLESAMRAIREGVDGYLLKPVTPKVLRSEVARALAAREERVDSQPAPPEDADLLERGPFSVDRHRHIVRLHGADVSLSSSEYKLLLFLLQNSERVVPPAELVEAVRDYRPTDIAEARGIMKWYIHALRQRIEPDPKHPKYIVNVRGVGYRFDAS